MCYLSICGAKRRRKIPNIYVLLGTRRTKNHTGFWNLSVARFLTDFPINYTYLCNLSVATFSWLAIN